MRDTNYARSALAASAAAFLLLAVPACGGGSGGGAAADRAADEEPAAAEQAARPDSSPAAGAGPDGGAVASGEGPTGERPDRSGAEGDERTVSAEPAPEAPWPQEEEPAGGEESASGEESTVGEESASEDSPAATRAVAAGTQLWLSLRDSLDSETARVGDDFAAEVTTPVTDGTYVLVPAGTPAYGHVTRVRPAHGDSAAVIAVAFDSLRVRDEAVPVAATVTDVKLRSRSEMKGEGKKIGIGAAAGAVVGAVVGKDVKGALIGAAGGAAAGTAVALGTQARYAVIPAGSEVTLRLDEPVEVQIPR